MGSRSDWETMSHAAATLDELGVPHEVRVVSAHRTPDLLFRYAAQAAGRAVACRNSGVLVTPSPSASRSVSVKRLDGQ